jgi:hypothetical protein
VGIVSFRSCTFYLSLVSFVWIVWNHLDVIKGIRESRLVAGELLRDLPASSSDIISTSIGSSAHRA